MWFSWVVPPEEAGSELEPKERRAFFPATHWTQIAVINDSDHPDSRTALERLCRVYLPAIEAFLRWMKEVPGEPTELANEFLAEFLNQDSLKRVDRSKGKFRNYLSGALRNFLRNKWRERKKDRLLVELDDQLDYPQTEAAAVAEFDRKVAEVLVETAIRNVVQRFRGSKIEPQIPVLLPYLTSNPPEETMKELASRLGVSADLIYQNFKRIRTELNRQLRFEVKKHLGPEDDPEEELQALLMAYSRG